jgi:hypothetical protein
LFLYRIGRTVVIGKFNHWLAAADTFTIRVRITTVTIRENPIFISIFTFTVCLRISVYVLIIFRGMLAPSGWKASRKSCSVLLGSRSVVAGDGSLAPGVNERPNLARLAFCVNAGDWPSLRAT